MEWTIWAKNKAKLINIIQKHLNHGNYLLLLKIAGRLWKEKLRIQMLSTVAGCWPRRRKRRLICRRQGQVGATRKNSLNCPTAGKGKGRRQGPGSLAAVPENEFIGLKKFLASLSSIYELSSRLDTLNHPGTRIFWHRRKWEAGHFLMAASAGVAGSAS